MNKEALNFVEMGCKKIPNIRKNINIKIATFNRELHSNSSERCPALRQLIFFKILLRMKH